MKISPNEDLNDRGPFPRSQDLLASVPVGEARAIGYLPSRLAATIYECDEGRPMRPVGRRRGRRPGGLYYSAKMGCLIGYESDNEKFDLYRAEVDPNLVGYREQPHTIEGVIDGKLRRYTPDREDRFSDGRIEIVEVKDDFEADSDPDYTLKLNYFAEVYEHLGWSFRLTTRSEIKDPATFGTVEVIQRYRRVGFTPVELAAVRGAVRAQASCCLGALVPIFESETIALPKLCAMMVARALILDLTSRLEPASIVRLTEIVVQWLRRNPSHRIMLSSQTHIALDNVLERVAELDPKMELIRIGRIDEPKISDASKELLLEKRLEKWVAEVRRLAEAEMNQWAEQNGVDRSTVEVGMKVERLLQLLKRQADLRDEIAEIEAEQDELDGGEEGGAVDEDEIAEETTQLDSQIGVLEREVKGLRDEERKLRQAMAELGGYAKELAESKDVTELADWAGLFLRSGPVVEECRKRLALLEEWSLRVGRSPDFNAALLSSAQVIAGTCVGIAGVKGMEEVAYDLCIVDEASKATATEILIPMVRSRRWIIVGDPKQLPPFFEELGDDLRAEFEDKEVKATMLDRLLDDRDGLPPGCRAALRNQYRMIKPIGDLVSDCFYDGQLNSPLKTHGLKLEHAFPRPVMWYSTHKLEDRTERSQGQTFNNPAEVAIIREHLQRLQFVAKMQRRRISVAVIAGYTGQVELLRDMELRGAAEWQDLDVVCNSVDAFQGRQADVCIYSVVRSNARGNLGFLRERPRLNVALSRGKSVLVIVGDQVFCRNVQGRNPFKAVIDYIDRHHDHCDTETVS